MTMGRFWGIDSLALITHLRKKKNYELQMYVDKKDHLSDKTAVIVGHSVGDDLSSAVRQLDCVGALGGEISWEGGWGV